MQNGDLYHALGYDDLSDFLTWYKKGKSIALDVAKGLYYLHSQGVVRLKPDAYFWQALPMGPSLLCTCCA